MEICKNKSSNLYFIYIDETGDTEALLITPEAKVKSLKLDLFGEVEEQEETRLLQNKLITEAQIQRFYEYKKSRSEDVAERVEYYFEQMTADQKEIFLQKAQEMLDK